MNLVPSSKTTVALKVSTSGPLSPVVMTALCQTPPSVYPVISPSKVTGTSVLRDVVNDVLTDELLFVVAEELGVIEVHVNDDDSGVNPVLAGLDHVVAVVDILRELRDGGIVNSLVKGDDDLAFASCGVSHDVCTTFQELFPAHPEACSPSAVVI